LSFYKLNNILIIKDLRISIVIPCFKVKNKIINVLEAVENYVDDIIIGSSPI
jgi:hypothetical protein